MYKAFSSRKAIRDALRRLMDRSTVGSVLDYLEFPRNTLPASTFGERNNPFVVFQDRNTGKFVQFSGDQDQPLLLDLPLHALMPGEQKRAAILFSKLGVNHPTIAQLYSYPSGEQTVLSHSYQFTFVEDVEAAVSITLETFLFVFGISEEELDLEIEEE